MPLEPHLVVWLSARICSKADVNELERPYAFHHDLNHARAIDAGLVDANLSWEVTFRGPDGEPLTTGGRPVCRSVTDVGGLWSDGSTGAVVENRMFMLRPQYHHQAFATAMYGAEEALYSRWNVREVQLLAVAAGLEVWPKKGFQPKEPEALRFSFRTWIRQRNEPPRDPPAELRDYPPEFLRSLGELQLYKVL